MKKPASPSATLTTGLAMFSMFFGAGNVVFPLALGQEAQTQNIYAIIGFLITAVGVPFLGLIAMTLFDGNYKLFFNRMGKWPGYLIALIIMALIGPLGALPRCIALSHAALHIYMPSLNLVIFSLISCVIIYLFTFRPNNIVDILGKFLTPFLLVALIVIIIKGLLAPTATVINTQPGHQVFLDGLVSGYKTMDLLGAFFFCSVVLACLQKGFDAPISSEHVNYKKMIFVTLKASCVGASLLAAIYLGFSFVSAHQSLNLADIAQETLLGVIAQQTLGPYAAIIASIAVALACLTTAIALAAVFAEFIHLHISFGKVSYNVSLIGTLICSFFISTLNFSGITNFLVPILVICYPALIMLCIVNIAHKLFHFKPVKTPVYIVFACSLAYNLLAS